MIKDETLDVGKTYFMISFYDREMMVPEIETYIYVGKNLIPDTESYWYFQDPDSYFEKGLFLNTPNKSDQEVMRVDKEALEMFYDMDSLINELLEIRSRYT